MRQEVMSRRRVSVFTIRLPMKQACRRSCRIRSGAAAPSEEKQGRQSECKETQFLLRNPAGKLRMFSHTQFSAVPIKTSTLT